MARFLTRLAVVVLALAANLLLFALAPLLSVREEVQPNLDPPLKSIYLTRYSPAEENQEEVFRKPLPRKEIPAPPPRLQFQKRPSLKRPKVDLEVPKLSFSINPLLTEGIPVSAPPPPQLPSEFEAGQVDQPPRVISRVDPIYPYSAKRRGVSGVVVVRFLVDIQGRIQRLKIVESKPHGVFEDSVRRAVAKWRFKPGVYQGRAVPTWVVVPLRFKLTG